MKNINKILITLSLVFGITYADEPVIPNDDLNTSDTSFSEVSLVDEQLTEDKIQVEDATENAQDIETIEKIVDAPSDDTYSDLDLEPELNDTADAKETMQNSPTMSEFEKLFVNHTAYIYYSTGVKDLYEANYKSAYENAMKAIAIYDNTQNKVEQIIALPYMPSYIRESAYTPKRIYYKMVKSKPYELKRLIIKAKLISPPIASVVLKRTSTYMDIITKNYGDLPLDEFEIILNDEPIAKYKKILPNEQKTTRVDLAPNLYEISFKEKYGFAPNSIMLSEGE